MPDSYADSETLIQSLARPSGFGPSVEIIETHISWVLLTGERAYKIKKPVVLPFADFGTLARRKMLCEVEIRLNRRLAPDLYLGVVPIGGTVDAPVVGVAVGAEPAIEYAVEMVQFPPSERLDHVIERGEVTADSICTLAETIATFHGTLPPDVDDQKLGGSRSVIDAALENFDELNAMLGGNTALVCGLEQWTQAECARLAPEFDERKRGGAVIEGHGDLHTENIVRLAEGPEGRLTPFDALEFNAELRWTDRMAEIGFLVMDLAVRERVDLAFGFLNRWLECTGDYVGLSVFRFYVVYRAMVRVKVAAIGHTQHGERVLDPSNAHLRFAESTATQRSPLLAITHGLSGSGKTTVTDELIGALRIVRVRSDVERKRLHGLGASAASDSALGEGLYSTDASSDTYAHLERCAASALAGGLSIVVDATFLRRADRERFAALAKAQGARFAIIDCTAPDDVLRERVASRAARGGDASEATLEVLEHQLRTREPLDAAECDARVAIDTTRPLDVDTLCRALK